MLDVAATVETGPFPLPNARVPSEPCRRDHRRCGVDRFRIGRGEAGAVIADQHNGRPAERVDQRRTDREYFRHANRDHRRQESAEGGNAGGEEAEAPDEHLVDRIAGRYPQRKGRDSERHRAYLCTTIVQYRKPVFGDWRIGRLVVDALRWRDAIGATRTITFVVMPDHLHWLFELTGGDSLSQVIGGVKKRTTMQINRTCGTEGRLWQPGFHDHAVRREEDLKALASYVVHNPVRAGIARSIREYPLWDAMWL